MTDDACSPTVYDTPAVELSFTPPQRVAVRNADIKRLLYIRLDAIGDAVLAAGLLPSLRTVYPNAEIIAVCDHACAPVYADANYVDRIIELPKNSLHTDEGFHTARRTLEAAGADLVLNFVRSNTPYTLALSLLCGAPLLAVANNTSNMHPDNRNFLQNYVQTLIPLPDELPEIEVYDRVLDFYGLKHEPCFPFMPVGDEARAKATQLWSETGFAPDKTIAAFAAAGVSCRDYPLLGAALAPVCKKYGFSVLTLGGKGHEREVNHMVVDALRSHGIPALNLSGRLQLVESTALLGACRLAVGVETSLAHIACALSVPNVVVLGGGHFGRFMPYSPKTIAVCLPLECFNCEWRCPHPDTYCISGVRPPAITQAVRIALEQGDAGKSGRLLMQGSVAKSQAQDMPRRQIPRKFITSRRGRDLTVMTTR
ncbi:MAG: glycosyltransferase family 9 protein [Desulfovibrio sp.]|jgi:ADP-heptose:LPS heptosyltransferase|nr:glycosyltransferase family 9 protein [Desulfovibrio sp.]